MYFYSLLIFDVVNVSIITTQELILILGKNIQGTSNNQIAQA